MKSSKVFWGIFFILAAVYVVISKFGILPDIGVFSIILTVFFLWLFVEGIRNVNFWEILFSVAFICIIYDEPLEITALTPWTVLGAAFLGSIGLSLIFGGEKRKWKTVTGNVGTSSSEQYTGEEIRCENMICLRWCASPASSTGARVSADLPSAKGAKWRRSGSSLARTSSSPSTMMTMTLKKMMNEKICGFRSLAWVCRPR